MTSELTRADLGWSAFYTSPLDVEEFEAATQARVSAVHRNKIAALT
jgi:hypothetical protein